MKLNSISIYFLTNLTLAVLPMATLPIFTRYMTPADYGVWGFFNLLAMYLGVISRWELNSALKFNYVKLKKIEFSDCIKAAFVFSFFVMVLFILIWVFLFAWGEGWNGVESTWIFALIIIAFMKVQSINLHNLFQISERSILYCIWALCSNIGLYAISLLLMSYSSMAWEARGWAELIIAAVSFLVTLYYFKSDFALNFELNFDFKIMYRMLKFSTPIMGAAVINFYISTIDRLTIAGEFNPQIFGLYMVALQVSSSLSLIFNSISPAWESSIYNSSQTSSVINVKIHLRKLILLSIGVLIIVIASPDILIWILKKLTTKDYDEASIYIFPTMIMIAASGIFSLLQPLMIVLNKNKEFLQIKIGMFIFITINMSYFVESYGPKGPAYGLAFCYFLGAVAVIVLINKDSNSKPIRSNEL